MDIRHRGVIKEIESDIIRVALLESSDCASCSAKGVCSAALSGGKVIDVPYLGHMGDGGVKYSVGDNVDVIISRSLGIKALFLGYIFPFIVLVVVLISLDRLFKQEWLAGILALVSLGMYYFLLYLFREKINKNFIFKIVPITRETV